MRGILINAAVTLAIVTVAWRVPQARMLVFPPSA